MTADDLIQAIVGADFLRPVHTQDDLVGKPVRGEVHRHREKEAGDHPRTAAEHVADGEKQSAHDAKEQRRFQYVGHGFIVILNVPGVR